MIAVIYVRDPGKIFREHRLRLEAYESWFFWMLNPAGVTMVSYRLSACLQGLSEWCSKAFNQVDPVTFSHVVSRVSQELLAAIKRAKQSVQEEPCFHVAFALWIVQGIISWWFISDESGLPVALTIFDSLEDSSPSDDLSRSEERFALRLSNAALVDGIAMKAWRVFLQRRDSIIAIQEPQRSTDGTRTRKRCGTSAADSSVPVLLVGWGIGYWVTSLLFLLGISWHDGGWENAPLAVEIIGYVCVPSFFVAGIFMVADTNFLGENIGAFIEPAIEIVRDRRRVVYWTMLTVFRDALLVWVGLCRDLVNYLVKYW